MRPQNSRRGPLAAALWYTAHSRDNRGQNDTKRPGDHLITGPLCVVLV